MTTGKPSRGRTISVLILGILACFAITVSASALWVHQVALNTDRYVSVISHVASEPEVIDEVSTTLADRVVERIEVPQLVKPLLQNWIQEQIAGFMASDGFAEAWTEANRLAHAALVRVLRSDAILPEEPVTISVWQLLIIGLERLQEVGVVPDDIDLPDPSSSAATAAAVRQILEERLNLDLPPDFGQITLVRSERLETARQIVRIFDILTVVSVILAITLVAVTIYLSRNRVRAVVFLGLGAAIAALAAIGTTAAISGFVARALAEVGARNTLSALLNALLGNLATGLAIVFVLGVAAAIAAVLIGRSPAPPPKVLAPAGPAPAPPPAPPMSPPPTESASSPPAAAGTEPSSTAAAAASPAGSTAKPRRKPAAKPAPKKTRPPKDPTSET